VSAPSLAQVPQLTEKAVRVVLPNATGSGVDTITRTAQPALAKALGKPVVIENQPGAGGIVGLQTLTRAAPDGMTLSVVSNNVVIFPSVYKSLPFELPAGHHAARHRRLHADRAGGQSQGTGEGREGIDRAPEGTARARSITARAATGRSCISRRSSFLDEAGVKATHVPVQGRRAHGDGPPGAARSTSSPPRCRASSSILRADRFARSAWQRRSASQAAPDIPTFVEQGLPGYVVEAWFAVIAPKGMPPTEVSRVHDAVVAAFADPAVKEAMAKQGNVINVSTSDYARDFFRTELAKYAAIVKKAGIEPQ
jgi:tripartite-type tricarboxylate transporter receptor subunit TctC